MADAKTEELLPCPVCGNEERGQGGYLSCECPAPALQPADVPHGVMRALETELQRFREERGYVVGWNDGHEHGFAEAMTACIEIANEKVAELSKPFSDKMAVGTHAVAAEIGAALAARGALATPAPSTSTEEALRAENARLHADREAVWQWIRKPDWEDEFDLVSWLNNRPCSMTVPLREETAERERAALSALSR